MKTVAIIPAYNEERTIQSVVRSVLSQVDEVIVVDDGSVDRTVDEAQHERVVVVSHPLNCGLGAAIATGFILARERNADFAVTIDADGQLFASDIRAVLTPLINGECDVVIGSRFLTTHSPIPLLRKFYNSIGNFVTFLLFGIYTSDSQSGIRAFSRSGLFFVDLRCARMEVSSEFFGEIKAKNLRWREVPIHVQYTAYSLSKGQGFRRGIVTTFRLIIRRMYRL